MSTTTATARITRALGIGILVCSVTLGISSFAAAEESAVDAPTDPTAAAGEESAVDTPTDPTAGAGEEPAEPKDSDPAPSTLSAPPAAVSAVDGGYGSGYPVTSEATFSRPYRAISSKDNSDFTLLDDMERLIMGTYLNDPDDPDKGLRNFNDRKATVIRISVSRMENSYRVGRKLVEAMKRGVKVYFIHGIASQSKESRALQSQLNNHPNGQFKICVKGKSNACLSSLNGAIMHTKLLLISTSKTRAGEPARGIVWTGSANLGGPSGERTYNNALTVYNDKTLYLQMYELWNDMWAERNVGNDYPAYVQGKARGSGSEATRYYGATYGVFYSEAAKATFYATPIKATPTNGRDPVVNALNRVIPGPDCRIRVMHNRFKYRRLFVAHQLQELQSQGCKVSAIAFEDDLKVNRAAHCQLYIRICQPILDEFRKASNPIEVAWAKPHDKTLLIEARMKRNPWNKAEKLPNGQPWKDGETAYLKFVQAGSAALTGSNLVVSDEITTETYDEEIYEDYLQHWKAIWKSNEHRDYRY